MVRFTLLLLVLLIALPLSAEEVDTHYRLKPGQQFEDVTESTFETTSGSSTESHRVRCVTRIRVDEFKNNLWTISAVCEDFKILSGDIDIDPHTFGFLKKGEKLVFRIDRLGWVKETLLEPMNRYWNIYFNFFGFPWPKITTDKPWGLEYQNVKGKLGNVKQAEHLKLLKVRRVGRKTEGLLEYTNNEYNSPQTYWTYATYKLVWDDKLGIITRGTATHRSRRPAFSFNQDREAKPMEFRTDSQWKMRPLRQGSPQEDWLD